MSVADELRAKTKQVFIESEHCKELLTKGHARLNPVFSFPDCTKWPEQFVRTNKPSPSLKMKQIPYEKKLGDSNVDNWAGSSSQQGLTSNTTYPQNPILHREVNGTENIFPAARVCKWTYPCSCDYINNDCILIPHTHSLDCTCMKPHYLPYNFLSETFPHHSPTQSGYCEHQGRRQVLRSQGHSGHLKNKGIQPQCQQTDTLMYPESRKGIYKDPNDHITHQQHPVMIKPPWNHSHFTGNDCPSSVQKEHFNSFTESHQNQKKEIYALICGVYTKVEVDQAMATNPESTNILELATLIQNTRMTQLCKQHSLLKYN